MWLFAVSLQLHFLGPFLASSVRVSSSCLVGAPYFFPASSSRLPFCRSSDSPVFDMPTVSFESFLNYGCSRTFVGMLADTSSPSPMTSPLPVLRRLDVWDRLRCRHGCFPRVAHFCWCVLQQRLRVARDFLDSSAFHHCLFADAAFSVVFYDHFGPSFLVFRSLFSTRCNVSPSCGGLGRCHASSSSPLGVRLIKVPHFTTIVTCGFSLV